MRNRKRPSAEFSNVAGAVGFSASGPSSPDAGPSGAPDGAPTTPSKAQISPIKDDSSEGENTTPTQDESRRAEAPEMQLMPEKIGASADDLGDLWDDAVDGGLRPEEHVPRRASKTEKLMIYGQGGICALVCVGILAGILIPLLTAKLDPGFAKAIRGGHMDAVRDMLNDEKNTGATVNAQGEDQKTGLHWAVIKNQPYMVSYLLEQRANIELGSEGGDAAIHYAAREGHTEILSILLGEAPPANVNHTNANGWTPLHWAALYGHPGVTKQLIEADIDVFAEAQDEHHKSALSLAKSNGHAAVVKIIDEAMEEAEHSHKVAKRDRYPTEKR